MVFHAELMQLLLLQYENEELVDYVAVDLDSVFLTQSVVPHMITLRTTDTFHVKEGYIGTIPTVQWTKIEQEINECILLMEHSERTISPSKPKNIRTTTVSTERQFSSSAGVASKEYHGSPTKPKVLEQEKLMQHNIEESASVIDKPFSSNNFYNHLKRRQQHFLYEFGYNPDVADVTSRYIKWLRRLPDDYLGIEMPTAFAEAEGSDRAAPMPLRDILRVKPHQLRCSDVEYDIIDLSDRRKTQLKKYRRRKRNYYFHKRKPLPEKSPTKIISKYEKLIPTVEELRRMLHPGQTLYGSEDKSFEEYGLYESRYGRQISDQEDSKQEQNLDSGNRNAQRSKISKVLASAHSSALPEKPRTSGAVTSHQSSAFDKMDLRAQTVHAARLGSTEYRSNPMTFGDVFGYYASGHIARGEDVSFFLDGRPPPAELKQWLSPTVPLAPPVVAAGRKPPVNRSQRIVSSRRKSKALVKTSSPAKNIMYRGVLSDETQTESNIATSQLIDLRVTIPTNDTQEETSEKETFNYEEKIILLVESRKIMQVIIFQGIGFSNFSIKCH